ncbi:MAG: hypothetical protein IKK95_03585, partial [Lachnospiraceae bacterium]|nr:hypothetical protein [Lachnospiraceae bacterium]
DQERFLPAGKRKNAFNGTARIVLKGSKTMKTKYDGLWEQEKPGVYAGPVIKKKDIPAYTRIILRFNKFYVKGGNRPKFVYRFADAQGFYEECVPIEIEDECDSLEEEEETKEKIAELSDVLAEANYCPMMLPSESQARARELMQRAIELVEEITGHEWRFEYLRF